jgi:hypothetical protein
LLPGGNERVVGSACEWRKGFGISVHEEAGSLGAEVLQGIREDLGLGSRSHFQGLRRLEGGIAENSVFCYLADICGSSIKF